MAGATRQLKDGEVVNRHTDLLADDARPEEPPGNGVGELCEPRLIDHQDGIGKLVEQRLRQGGGHR